MTDTFDLLAVHLERFVAAWSSTETPRIREHLPSDERMQRLVAIELVKLDLEYRWRDGVEPQYVEDYVTELSLLGPEAPLELIYEEWHVRQHAGLQVTADEYIERFPEQKDALMRLLDPGVTTASIAMVDRLSRQTLSEVQPGQTFDDFDLLSELGRGAFGTVFLARQRSMQRLVALKISPDRGDEAQTLAQFDHDYIVRVYDQRSIPDKGVRLLYMQYVQGGTLREVIAGVQGAQNDSATGHLLFEAVDNELARRGESRSVRSPWRQELEEGAWINTVCWLGACMAEGLTHAHSQHVLHRDLKPANVLLTSEGIPKLADFNISYCSKLDGTSAEAFLGGSLAYMSPEQLDACNPQHSAAADSIDERTDLYSLGIVLYELTVGSRPFSDPKPEEDWGNILGELTRQRRERDYTYPDTLDLPEVVRETIDGCLAPDREKRWPQASQLARRLDLCVHPSIREFLFPDASSLRRRVIPWLRLTLLFSILLPSLLAAVFNYFYNEQEIIQRLAPAAKSHFMVVQAIINLIAFPVGLWISDRVIRSSLRQLNPSKLDTESPAWLDVTNLGHRGGLVTLAMWGSAGLAYPISMSMQATPTPSGLNTHFFFSLLLSGVFATALTYFVFTAFSILVLVPAYIRLGWLEDKLGFAVESLRRRNWFYLMASATVPMLATVALSLVNSQTSRGFLGLIGVGGMLAFGFNLGLMMRIERGSRRLEAAFRNSPTAGFERRH